MSVYADVVLAINFIMNSTILVLTAYLAGFPIRWRRILPTAVIGSIYALGGVFPEISLLYTIAGKLAASVAIVVLAFGWRTVKITLLTTGIFFVVSFILGGALVGWLYFVQMEAPYKADHMVWLSWNNLLIGSVIAIILILFIVKRMLANLNRRKALYRARIDYAGRCQEITGLLDTGNALYSLWGRKPVVLLAYRSALELLGPQAADFLSSHSSDTWLDNLDTCQDRAWLSRVEIIPCQSVAGRNMLLGFRPDSITVLCENGAAATTAELIIGIYDGVFLAGSDCQALLHPALMAGINITKEAGTCALPGQ